MGTSTGTATLADGSTGGIDGAGCRRRRGGAPSRGRRGLAFRRRQRSRLRAVPARISAFAGHRSTRRPCSQPRRFVASGGALAVLEEFRPRRVIDNGASDRSSVHQARVVRPGEGKSREQVFFGFHRDATGAHSLFQSRLQGESGRRPGVGRAANRRRKTSRSACFRRRAENGKCTSAAGLKNCAATF